ncbi:MAG TPA: universal stress protein [Holophagaceae bacterium]|nr:universal stress protein [Holophagaceae bacterium]
MNPWQAILAAVQVDSSSDAVLDQATRLALLSGAELDLIHVFETPGYGGPQALVPVAGKVELAGLEPWRSAKTMAGLMNDLIAKGVRVGRGHLVMGIVEDRLGHFTRQRPYDLLIIGNHSPSRLERMLSGDLVGHLVNHASCPVLVVPHH